MIDAPTTTEISLLDMGQAAREASYQLATATTAHKQAALRRMADLLDAEAEAILAANLLDLADGRAAGLSAGLLDRLSLQGRLTGIAADVRHVASLPDPVGRIYEQRTLENGLNVSKKRVPFGVLGVIYEARPNVTVDVAALALAAGNAVILRGGKETLRSNTALVAVLRRALAETGLPNEAIQFIDSPDRRYVAEMLRLHPYIDMIIPRGGNALHTFCRENSTIPVITGGIGVCHLYVDETADQAMALNVIHNAKVQRPAVCNALETLLVNAQVAADFLPRVAAHLGAAGVTFKAEPRALAAIGEHELVLPAEPGDFDTEWYALVLNVKVVDGLDDAIAHIRQHSTQHSDGILTRDMAAAQRFLDEVDSAAVYVNASTRFTDGGALGLGAEVAVSTQKLHARGPMALEELTTYKWLIIGDGQIRL